MRTDIDRVIEKASRDLAQEQELYLMRFFGSREAIEAEGHRYVLEHWPARLVPSHAPRDHTYTIRQQFRLRLKTDEELAAEAPMHLGSEEDR